MVTKLAQSSALGANFTSAPLPSPPLTLSVMACTVPTLTSALVPELRPNLTACLAEAMPLISLAVNLAPVAARLCRVERDVREESGAPGCEEVWSELKEGALVAPAPMVLTENKLKQNGRRTKTCQKQVKNPRLPGVIAMLENKNDTSA